MRLYEGIMNTKTGTRDKGQKERKAQQTLPDLPQQDRQTLSTRAHKVTRLQSSQGGEQDTGGLYGRASSLKADACSVAEVLLVDNTLTVSSYLRALALRGRRYSSFGPHRLVRALGGEENLIPPAGFLCPLTASQHSTEERNPEIYRS